MGLLSFKPEYNAESGLFVWPESLALWCCAIVGPECDRADGTAVQWENGGGRTILTEVADVLRINISPSCCYEDGSVLSCPPSLCIAIYTTHPTHKVSMSFRCFFH